MGTDENHRPIHGCDVGSPDVDVVSPFLPPVLTPSAARALLRILIRRDIQTQVPLDERLSTGGKESA